MRKREKVVDDPAGADEVFTDRELRVDAAMVAQWCCVILEAQIDGPAPDERGSVALARVLAEAKALDRAGFVPKYGGRTVEEFARWRLERVRYHRRLWRQRA